MNAGSTFSLNGFIWTDNLYTQQNSGPVTWVNNSYMMVENCIATTPGTFMVTNPGIHLYFNQFNATSIPSGENTFVLISYDRRCVINRDITPFIASNAALPGMPNSILRLIKIGSCSGLDHEYMNDTATLSDKGLQVVLNAPNPCSYVIAVAVVVGVPTSLFGLIALSVIALRLIVGAGTTFYSSTADVEGGDYTSL